MRLKILLAFLLSMVPALAGCWDVETINRRGLPNAVFLDMGYPQGLKMGISIHVPGTMLPPYTGAEQQFEKRNFIVTAKGRSFVEAWRNLQTNTFRSTFFGQVEAIILSDKLAKSDMESMLNLPVREPSFPGTAQVLVTKSDPEKLLNLQLKSNLPPGDYIKRYMENPSKKALVQPAKLWQVFAALDNGTSDPAVPLIEESQGEYRIAGIALFSGPRMVGELDTDETGVLALLNGTTNGFMTVPLGGTNHIAFAGVNSKSQITPTIDAQGALTFAIISDISGSLEETPPRNKKITLDDQNEYSRLAEAFTKSQFEKLLAKLQSLRSDPVGFGEKVRIKYPRQWESMDWHHVYSSARFQVYTKFSIKNTGLKK